MLIKKSSRNYRQKSTKILVKKYIFGKATPHVTLTVTYRKSIFMNSE